MRSQHHAKHSLDIPLSNLTSLLLLLALGTFGTAFVGSRSVAAAAPGDTEAVQSSDSVFPIPLFSGRIAVLPDPMQADMRRSQIGQTLAALDLERHVVFLTPQQMVDPTVFNAETFPVALYGGGEPYWQTVREPGDGDAALLRYLSHAGQLLVLPSGPLPFFYSQDRDRAGSAGKFGLRIGGGSAFSEAPAGRKLTFQRQPGDTVFTTLPSEFPFPAPHQADQRWRPVTGAAGEGSSYQPLITLHDENGHVYGEGAATVQLSSGARVLYVWTSLMANDKLRRAIVLDALRFALDGLEPPPARLACPRVFEPIAIDANLNEAIWRGAPGSSPFVLRGELLQETPHATVVHACWDTQYLYLAFQCTAVTEPIATDRVQIAVAMPEESSPCFMLQLTTENQIELSGRTPDTSSQGDAAAIRSAVRDHEDRWLAEIAIPLTCLPSMIQPPRFGQLLPIQFSRTVTFLSETESAPASRILLDSVWSATDQLDRTDHFGALSFAPNPWSDNFDAYKASEDGSAYWTFLGGQWQIEDHTLVGTDACAHWAQLQGALRGDESWENYSLSVRFQVQSRGNGRYDGAWFGIRCSLEGDGYLLQLGDGVWYLHKIVYGIPTRLDNCLAQGSWTFDNKWHGLQMQVRDNWLEGTLDGRPLFAVKDDAHLTLPSRRRGGIMLVPGKMQRSGGTTRVRYDDVIVRMLEE